MIAAIVSLGGVALFLAGPIAAATGVMDPTKALGMFVFGALIGLIGGIWGIANFVFKKRTPSWALAGWIPVAVLAAAAVPAMRYPRINDITTDLASPPAFVYAATLEANASRDMSYPENFKPIVAESYPDVKPLVVDEDPAVTFDAAITVAKDLPHWTLTHEDKAAGIIEGYAQTALFGWRDDFVIRIAATDDGKTRIDMRSKSRDGQGDLGTNAKRIQSYLARVATTLGV